MLSAQHHARSSSMRDMKVQNNPMIELSPTTPGHESTRHPEKSTMSKFHKFRRLVRTNLEFPAASNYGLAYSVFSGFLIVMNVVVTIQSTMNNNGYIDRYNMKPHQFDIFNVSFCAIFSFDLLVRFLCAETYFNRYSPEKQLHKSYSSFPGRPLNKICLPFFRDLFNWCDLLSVLDVPLSIIYRALFPYHPTSQIVSLFRVFRLARFFTATRQLDATKIMSQTVYRSINGITMLLVMLICLVSVLALGLVYLEPCLEMDNCNFENGVAAIYFTFITITTVGYGDLAPTLPFAKILAIITMLIGAIYMAMPLAVLGTTFEEVYEEHAKNYVHIVKQRLLNVHRISRKDRIIRAMKTKDLVIKELYYLHHFTKKRAKGLLRKSLVNKQNLTDEQRQSELFNQRNSFKPQQNSFKSPAGTKDESHKQHQLLLSELCKDAGQLVVDINVLFDLKSEALETLASKQSKKKRKTLNRKETRIQHDMEELFAQGHKEVIRLHELHDKECTEIRTAIQRDNCHDRLFLCTKVKESSCKAMTYYRINHFMVFLNLMALFIESMHVMQVYGVNTDACKRVAKYHCTNIVEKYCDGKQQPSATDTSTCNATRQYNPGCFPNAAIAYKGCLDTCDFPAPMVNMTCPQNLVVGHTHNQHLTGGNKSVFAPFDEKWIKSPNKRCGFGHPTKTTCETDPICKWNDINDKCVEINGNVGATYVSKVAINVCERVQCNKNQNWSHLIDGGSDPYIFYKMFWWIEFVFMVWFLIDLLLNVIVNKNIHPKGYFFWWENSVSKTKSPSKSDDIYDDHNGDEQEHSFVFHYDFENFITFLTVVAQTLEIIYCTFMLYGQPTMKYTIYGNMWKGEPFDIRIFRVAIPLKFAVMQQDVFIILATTAQRVYRKLVVPYFFFVIISMIFATMFYAVESGDLFLDCELNDYAPRFPAWDSDPRNITTGCRWCPHPQSQRNADDVTNPYTKTVSSATNYYQVYRYNGSCTSYTRTYASGSERSNTLPGTGFEGRQLSEPLIHNMWDALMTMIVTMTTVGYGVRYPVQYAGRFISVVAALFGTFFLAMPLTIVGGEFHNIYLSFRKEQSDHNHAIVEALNSATKSAAELQNEMGKAEAENKRRSQKRHSTLGAAMSLGIAARLKLQAKKAKVAIIEKSMTGEEKDKLKDYIKMVAGLHSVHDVQTLLELEKEHRYVCLLMSIHFSHHHGIVTLIEDEWSEDNDAKQKLNAGLLSSVTIANKGTKVGTEEEKTKEKEKKQEKEDLLLVKFGQHVSSTR